jgi:trans-aconitate 2-methyltransferase
VSWSPERYLAYGGERARPALDLLARVPLDAPRRVYDLGCGPGTVTDLLAERWPEAAVVGVDSSAEMLARAPAGRIDWVRADIAEWTPAEPADLIFSNAALHWLDDHAALIPRLRGFLAPGGVLAVQMPNNFARPSHTCLAQAADAGPWRERVRAVLRPAPVAAPEVYFDLLAPVAAAVDVWETDYYHLLPAGAEHPVVAWTRGSVLRPLLAAAGADADAVLAAYADAVAAAYPLRADGTVLFPFKRLFIVARA